MNKLGIDIGRVIIGPTVEGRADTRFLGTTLQQAVLTPPAPGAIQTITALVGRLDHVCLISKCGESVERKSRAWLQHHRFYARTGVRPEDVHFCRKRPDKAPIAARIGLDAFIDDRVDVLRPMRGIVAGLYLFGEQSRVPPDWVVHLPDWGAVAERLISQGAPATSQSGC